MRIRFRSSLTTLLLLPLLVGIGIKWYRGPHEYTLAEEREWQRAEDEKNGYVALCGGCESCLRTAPSGHIGNSTARWFGTGRRWPCQSLGRRCMSTETANGMANAKRGIGMGACFARDNTKTTSQLANGFTTAMDWCTSE